METIKLNILSSLLFLLLLNFYIKHSTCDPFLEIPFIKKMLQDYRKKAWSDYYHKLLLQCINGPKINSLKITLSVMKVLEHLYKCLVKQHGEIYKAPQRIKKFKIYDMNAEMLKTGVVDADGIITAK